MNQPQTISESEFREIFKTRLGQRADRAIAVFGNYGPRLSYDVTNVMIHAAEKGKVEEVLKIMETHWEEHLQFQHPDIRGTVESMPGVNLTERMFLRICTETLALTPVAA